MKWYLRGPSQTSLTIFWLFLTTYPPALTFSILLMLAKSQHFWTTYPLLLDNVDCEWPLTYISCTVLFKRNSYDAFKGFVSMIQNVPSWSDARKCMFSMIVCLVWNSRDNPKQISRCLFHRKKSIYGHYKVAQRVHVFNLITWTHELPGS